MHGGASIFRNNPAGAAKFRGYERFHFSGNFLMPIRFSKNLSLRIRFAAGTSVLTIDGYRPVEDIRVGDRILA